MLGIIIGAGIRGIIIAVMEGGEFPGWGKMVIGVLAAGTPAMILNAALPPDLFFVGPLVGAVFAMFAITFTCGMDTKRSATAAGIYFAIQVVLSLLLAAVFK